MFEKDQVWYSQELIVDRLQVQAVSTVNGESERLDLDEFVTRDTYDSYRAVGLEFEATLGKKEAIPGNSDDGFGKEDFWYSQQLVVGKVTVRAANVASGETETLDLDQFDLGKSCRSWLVRIARLIF